MSASRIAPLLAAACLAGGCAVLPDVNTTLAAARAAALRDADADPAARAAALGADMATAARCVVDWYEMTKGTPTVDGIAGVAAMAAGGAGLPAGVAYLVARHVAVRQDRESYVDHCIEAAK